MVDVTIGADSVSFETSPPSTMQPTSAPVSVLTHHHATTQDGHVLAMHPTDATGSFDLHRLAHADEHHDGIVDR